MGPLYADKSVTQTRASNVNIENGGFPNTFVDIMHADQTCNF